ncbi:MAG: tripartite tricarboxylate transporter permease, partial [Candidatus Bilamarchaeaceae archaeon]
MFLVIVCVILGLLAGLVPGLHANLLTSALLSMGIEDVALPFAIIAMFGAQAISAYIPAIFLGIPDEQVVLSVLPGQRMAKEGRGLDALAIMVVSSIIAILACIALFPLSQALYPIVFPAIQPYLFHILALAVLFLALKSRKPLGYLFIFMVAGVIGREAFIIRVSDPFLPLFSGMFAMAAIITFSTAPLPEQKPPQKPDPSILKFALVGVAFGWLSDLLPGIGSPAQVAAFASIL